MKKFFVLIFLFTFLTACGKEQESIDPGQGGTEMNIHLSSSAFAEGEQIPQQYSCDGENISPPLQWSQPPPDTQSLALIVDDPDAPAGTFVHWVVFNLESDLAGLPEGGLQGASPAWVQGTNGFRKTEYGGPCPPRGKAHRYFFKLYALDAKMDLEQGASKAELERAMDGHILGQGQLMGTFTR